MTRREPGLAARRYRLWLGLVRAGSAWVQAMDASSMRGQREIALETIKNDLLALQNALDEVRRQSTNVVQRQIVEQPFQSITVAFAAGFVFSRLLGNRLF